MPLIEKCVSPVTVLVGRVFSPGPDPARCPPALADALAAAAAGTAPLFVLWPDAPGAVDLEEAVERVGGPYTLLAIDGTWRQAKEMSAAGGGWFLGGGAGGALPGVMAVRVGGPTPTSGALFVEPEGGVCVSTAEAVAAGLGVLEPEGAPGPAVLAGAVKGMAAVAASFDPAVAARLGLVEAWGRGVTK